MGRIASFLGSFLRGGWLEEVLLQVTGCRLQVVSFHDTDLKWLTTCNLQLVTCNLV